MTATARVLPGRRRLPRLFRPRGLAVLALLGLIAFGGWTWLRSSSLVAVRQVHITGVAGPDAGQIRAALRRAARRMTTLDASASVLHRVVARYPVVKHVQISTSFPHGMTIAVFEQVPVAQISAGGRTVQVGADGTLLHSTVNTGPLPTLSLNVAPGGERVTGETAQEVALLAAAPYPLLQRISGVSNVSGVGLVAQLRSGPKIVFGSVAEAAMKWQAAVAVLADGHSTGADYIDVTDPQRPAAGTGQDTSAGSLAAPSSAGATSTTGGAALPGVPTTAPGGTSVTSAAGAGPASSPASTPVTAAPAAPSGTSGTG